MRFWRVLRQSDRIAAIEAALQERITELRLFQENLESAERQLDRERAQRIAAEAVAAERRAEVERLVAEVAAQREQTRSVMADRLKSLDALNLKLMESRAEEKAPDMSQYKRSEEAAGRAIHTMERVRQMSAAMDNALLTKLHPKFQKFAKQPAPTEAA